MSEEVHCPDCGRLNPPGSDRCRWCNFPFVADSLGPAHVEPTPPPADDGVADESDATPASESSGAAPDEEPAAAATPDATTATRVEPAVPFRPLRPMRRRPKPVANQALSIWLLFAACCGVAVIYIAVKANVDRAREPIEGASTSQIERADELRAALAKDSTNVEALVGLGNVYYDTANWPQAIRYYTAALRRDSSRVSALVDLGVAYFNTANAKEAQRMFELALVRNPQHPIALFNLGIVAESHKDYDKALSYFHRALGSAPPDEMRPAIVEAMQRVQEATGKQPTPLPKN